MLNKQIIGISYNRWIQNHPVGHDAVWYRECMPWAVLRETDFSSNLIGIQQNIIINDEEFSVIVINIILQENGRSIAKIKISAKNPSKLSNEYPWDTIFSLFFDPSTYEFIKAFPSKDRPLKSSVKQFMCGRLEKLSSNRHSRLLYARTFMSFVTSELFPELDYLRYYNILDDYRPPNPLKKGLRPASRPAIPMFSNGRKFWIYFCWEESSAHRFGLRYSTQCDRMLIVFAIPVYTKHHRCEHKGVEILSLSEFVDRLRYPLRAFFDRQLWFIREGFLPDPDQELIWYPTRSEIKELVPIRLEELRESMSIRELNLENEHDVAYILSAYNLINAWVARIKDDQEFSDREGLFKELYSFKNRLSAAIARLTLVKIPNVNIFIDTSTSKNTTYVTVKGVQFSFHYLTLKNILIKYEKSKENAQIIKGDYLEDYSKSPDNQIQDWTSYRLQPIAPLILAWARRERRIAALEKLDSNLFHWEGK
jgi:hypothetical protein